MTFGQLYDRAKSRLKEAGIDSPEYDAAVLMEFIFDLTHAQLLIRKTETADRKKEMIFFSALEKRINRTPLQYIVKSWPFMGMQLQVGEGVLVPREDTEVLVRSCAALLKGIEKPHGIDLCAGTGAVALGICSLIPGAALYAAEFSDKAYPYLQQNLKKYPAFAIKPIQGDILTEDFRQGFPAGCFDFIISNPPYIETGELDGLQAEVQREPRLALDGGSDGLLFYRCIARQWLPYLRPGGILAVEIGDTQAEATGKIFQSAGLLEITVHRDLSGFDRCITAVKYCEK